jgi:hypothetical protein
MVPLLASCSADKGTPEDQVRALLAASEQAAEAKDLPALKDMIAGEYGDSRGNDRQAAVAIVRYHFLRNEAVHLLTRIGDIEFTGPGKAEVSLLVAMAGEPIPTADEIGTLRADLFRFDITLAAGADGKWRLVTASWGRAGPADFL